MKLIFSIILLLACPYSLAATQTQIESDLDLIDKNLKYITSDLTKKKAVMDLLQSTEKDVEALLEPYEVKHQLRERISSIYKNHPLIDPSQECPNMIEIRDGKGFRSIEQVRCANEKLVNRMEQIYRDAIENNGPIEGKVVFNLVIHPDGKSKISVSSSELPDEVAQKLRDELSKIQYPNAVGFAEIWDEQYTMAFFP